MSKRGQELRNHRRERKRERTPWNHEHPTGSEDKTRVVNLEVHGAFDHVEYLHKVSCDIDMLHSEAYRRGVLTHIGVIFGSFARFPAIRRDDKLASCDEFSVTKDLLEGPVVVRSGFGVHHLSRKRNTCVRPKE